jgi:hypothetical protein
MRKSVFVLAVIGAACSSVAFAAEVKKEKAHVPAVTMSDADMDKVTAGFSANQDPVFGGDPTKGWHKNFVLDHSNGRLSAGGCNRLGTC